MKGFEAVYLHDIIIIIYFCKLNGIFWIESIKLSLGFLFNYSTLVLGLITWLLSGIVLIRHLKQVDVVHFHSLTLIVRKEHCLTIGIRFVSSFEVSIVHDLVLFIVFGILTTSRDLLHGLRHKQLLF